MQINCSFPSPNRMDYHHIKFSATHWWQQWQWNTPTLAQVLNPIIPSCIHAISDDDSHGYSYVTSWYVQPDSSSLLPPFWINSHLCIDLYMFHNSTNDSQLSWRIISFRSSEKRHSSWTALRLWGSLLPIASKFYICITQRK